jgi:heme ABC exporter ATP-binding subunit CcmA
VTEEIRRAVDPSGPALELRGVAKRFGTTWALRGVDLEVARGELVALTGPNGAGKTTLLQIVATLVAPTRGEVSVLGLRPDEAPDAVRRRTGYLPARGYLYDELTARENLRFASLMSGVRDWSGPAEAALARVGLADAADLRVRGFSSGMRKRLALARLLLRPAGLALLDEPYASLDREGVELVDDLAAELLAEGAAVVMASHRWGRSLRAADRVVSLRRGKVAWVGGPDEYARRGGGHGPASDPPAADDPGGFARAADTPDGTGPPPRGGRDGDAGGEAP